VNSWGSPQRSVVCHLFDQIDLCLWDFRPAKHGSTFPFPIQPEAFFVPPDDGFWLEDEKRLFPTVEYIGHEAEEEPIGRSQSGSRGRASEYFQLLSEKDVLESDLGG
jgi:hypothetical protein